MRHRIQSFRTTEEGASVEKEDNTQLLTQNSIQVCRFDPVESSDTNSNSVSIGVKDTCSSINKNLSLFYSERIIICDIWEGDIIAVADDTIDVELYLNKCRAIKRALRVKKRILVGDTSNIEVGKKIRYTYTEYEGYRSNPNNKPEIETEYRILPQNKIDNDALLESVERKIKRYSYIFEEASKE